MRYLSCEENLFKHLFEYQRVFEIILFDCFLQTTKKAGQSIQPSKKD